MYINDLVAACACFLARTGESRVEFTADDFDRLREMGMPQVSVTRTKHGTIVVSFVEMKP